jgi:magnesium chelatase family protein
VRARRRQERRNGVCNARLEGKMIEKICCPGDAGLALLEVAVDKFNLSARAYQSVLRVARTIADLAAEEDIAAAHVAEALSLRQLDRGRH